MLLQLTCWGMVVTMMNKDATFDLLGYGGNNDE